MKRQSIVNRISEHLEDTVIILIEEYHMDGVGQNITIVYPSNLEEYFEDSEDYSDFMDYLGEAYHCILEYHISDDKHLQIWQNS